MDDSDLRKRTFDFSRRIIRLYASLAKEPLPQTIVKQCLRSGTSIGANYREAYRARSKAEFVAKIGDCLKEAEETQYWLELMIVEEIVPENKLDKLVEAANELMAIFVSSMNTAKSNATA